VDERVELAAGAGSPALRGTLVVLGEGEHAVGMRLLQVRVDGAALAVADAELGPGFVHTSILQCRPRGGGRP
jgi:hypothetical protein